MKDEIAGERKEAMRSGDGGGGGGEAEKDWGWVKERRGGRIGPLGRDLVDRPMVRDHYGPP